MTSTLFGLFNAQRSLSLNQAVIDVINSNIANVNTPGYSKQRAELAQLSSGNITSIPQDAAQDCLGAIITEISRNRDVYLDNFLRSETSNKFYYKELSENAILIEDITKEIGDTGINSSLDEFYKALSQLSLNADDYVVRNVVVQRALELTTKMNSIYTQLENQRINLVGDYSDPDTLLSSRVKLISDGLNDKLTSVANLNDSIVRSTSQGTSPNYLLDQRDTLLDEISEIIPIELTSHSNGSITITLGSTVLVSGGAQTGFFNVVSGVDENYPAIIQIENDSGGVLVPDAYSIINSGRLGGILEMGGSEAGKLTVKAVMDNLNTLAFELANEINTLQSNGRYIDNSGSPLELSNNTSNPIDGLQPLDADPVDFFIDPGAGTITAGNITVNTAIINNPYQISAADLTGGFEDLGDGANALLMAQIRNKEIANLGGATTEQYITNVIGDAGSKANSISNNFDIKDNITRQLSLKREAATGVNLDEEMTDLIRFQRSYEASARVLNVVNDNIKTILAMVR